MTNELLTHMGRGEKRVIAMTVLRTVICDLLLDDPNDPTIPKMLNKLRAWQDEQHTELEEA